MADAASRTPQPDQPSAVGPYRLTTFGGLCLQSRQAEVLRHVTPRQLAILATLAAHGQAGIGRDRLILLFWPDSTRSRGRNALHQAIHAIRATLGADAILTGTLELRLNPHIVRSDVAEFRERYAAGDVTAAARLYSGPFLDGVYVKDAVEFERWADEARQGLAEIYLKTLKSLYATATARGAWIEAAEYASRIATIDPSGSAILPLVSVDAHRRELEALRDVGPQPVLSVEASPRVATRRRRWAIKPVPIATFATAVLAIVGGASWMNRQAPPETMWQESQAEHARILAERERSNRGRVFIETPIVQTTGAVYDSLAESILRWSHAMLASSKIAHVVPRDTVVAIERAAADFQGLNSPAIRFARANARIGVMTVITAEGDSIRVRMTVQRTAPIQVSKAEGGWSAFWQRFRVSSRKTEATSPWIETAVSMVRTVPVDSKLRRSVAIEMVLDLSKALDGMRSCDVEAHLDPKALPWCWRRENEPVLIAGLARARRMARAGKADGGVTLSR